MLRRLLLLGPRCRPAITGNASLRARAASAQHFSTGTMDKIPTTAGVNKTPVHPEVVTLLRRTKELGIKPFWELSVEEGRAMKERTYAAFSGTFDFDGRIWDAEVPSKNVEDGIPVRIYRPNTSREDPAIMMYFHGGGMVVGSVRGYDTCCRMLAHMCDVIVVSVEYRRAPEYQLPTQIEDCEDATRWVMQNKTAVGGTDKSLVGVSGDSCGGQSTAMSCFYVDGNSFQVIIYGLLDERSGQPSYEEFGDCPVLGKQALDWYQKYRLPDLGPSRTNPRFSALLQKKFDHLPPALFVVAECDPLRDENYEYAEILRNAGVHTELHLVKGVLHGFFHLPGIYKECCTEAYTKIASFVKRMVYKEEN